jgi:hypothetical protein
VLNNVLSFIDYKIIIWYEILVAGKIVTLKGEPIRAQYLLERFVTP